MLQLRQFVLIAYRLTQKDNTCRVSTGIEKQIVNGIGPAYSYGTKHQVVWCHMNSA